MDIERAKEALMNAHKAGDTQAATMLAQKIRAHMDSAGPAQQQSQNAPEASLGDTLLGGYAKAADGVLMGFADEAQGVFQALPRAAYNAYQGKDFDLGKAYEEGRDSFRGLSKNFQENNPVAGTALEIGGAVVSPVNKVLGPLAVAGKTAGTVERVGRLGSTGGLYGALFGAGNAEGSLGDRLEGAGEGALIGAVAGTVLAPAVMGLFKLGRASAQRILSGFQNLTAAERKVAHEIAKLGDGDLQAGILKIEERLKAGGKDTAIADVGGIGLQRQARAAANVPGPGSQIADDFVARRVAGRGDRFRAAGDDLAAADDIPTKLDTLKAQRANQSRPIYQRSVNPENLVPEGKMIQDEFLNSVFQKVQKDKLAGMEGLPPNSMPVIDAVKKELDDMIGAAIRKGEGNRARLLSEKRDQLVQMADDAFPDYPAAREAWAAPTRVSNALEDGAKFAKMEPSQIRKTLANMAPEEAEMFRTGARSALDKMISADTQTAASKFADKKEALWAKIRAVFPDEASFNAYKQKIGTEINKFRTEQLVSPKSGSQTTPLKEDIANLSRVPNWTQEIAALLANKQFGQAAALPLKGAYNKLTAPSQGHAEEIARALLSTKPEANRQLLNKLSTGPNPGLTADRRRLMAELLMAPTAGEPAAYWTRYSQRP